MSVPIETTPRFATGVPGLDKVLHGGLPRCALVLVEGPPGSGKTTMALQFLIQPVRAGESCLPRDERRVAAAVAVDRRIARMGSRRDQYHRPVGAIQRGRGARLYALPGSGGRDRRDIRPSFFRSRTVETKAARARYDLESACCSADSGLPSAPTETYSRLHGGTTEKDLRSKTMSDGIIEVRQKQSSYGADRRALRVSKLRGCSYVSGSHDVTIATGGLTVHPRLVAQSFPSLVGAPALGSGNSQIDALVGGGLPRGSNTLIAGPAGVGKSTIASLYAMAAAKRGEKCARFSVRRERGELYRSQRGTGPGDGR